MLIQLTNIASGLILLTPELQKINALKSFGNDLHRLAAPHLKWIGIAEFALGIVALLDRMDIIHTNLWSSYPQAVFAIPMGLLLASNFFHKYDIARSAINAIQPYKAYVALGGIIVGLNSIL